MKNTTVAQLALFKDFSFRYMYETYIESCLVGSYLRSELIKASSTDAKVALFILLDGFAFVIATRCLYYSTVAEFRYLI